jgi:dienelactone hydrolase
MHLGKTIAVAMLAACGGTTAPMGDDGNGDDDDAGQDPDAATAAPDAGGVAVADPGSPGIWVVDELEGTIETALGDAGITVYSPSSGGPFPLVIVSTGFQIGRDSYAATCRHLASWGYVVLAHDYTAGNHQEKAAEIGDLIDGAIAQLGARIDATRIAVAGHSLGGKVSINAAILDARIDAVIGWDPVDALPPFSDGSTSVTPELMDGLTVPLAVIGETLDGSCAPSADNYVRFFEAACDAPGALEVTVAGADHTDWVDDRSACGFACLVCATGTTDDATTREITRRVTTAWLQVHLRGLDEYASFLAAPGAPATIRDTVPSC